MNHGPHGPHGQCRLIARLCAAALLIGIAGAAFGQGLEFSGVLDSTVILGTGAGEGPDFYYGLEEYANLRMQAKLREGAAFYGALNLIAAAGSPAVAAAAMGAGTVVTETAATETAATETAVAAPVARYPGFAPSAFVAGENYAAALELERLYFRLNGEHLDVEGGLMRIAFGYGAVFGPSDFLNPKNPLLPDARPRAVLGGTIAAYPLDSLKLRLFGAAPRNPLSPEGKGGLAGLSGDQHWDRASLQVLYVFESPQSGSPENAPLGNTPLGIHRAGLSLKADLELGFTVDALYTYNPEAGIGMEGLSASGGCDYSFAGGSWYVQAEYLYNGSASSTSAQSGNPAGFSGEHLLYAGATWLYSDYTTFTLACLSSLSDYSFAPVLRAEHELLQGFALSLSASVPLDRDLLFADGKRGELGPLPPNQNSGSYFTLNARVRLRF